MPETPDFEAIAIKLALYVSHRNGKRIKNVRYAWVSSYGRRAARAPRA